MSRRNYRAEACAECGAHVAAQAGTLKGPPWRVYCSTCLPLDGQDAPYVAASIEGHSVALRLRGGFLGGDRFAAYREATRGGRFASDNGRDKRTLVGAGDAARVLAALTEMGLELRLDMDVQCLLEEHAEALASSQTEARDRLEDIDAQLQARGQALYDYQRTGIPWLAARPSGLLADDMGLGKTLQALLAAPEGAPILVIAPAVAKGVWVREVAKWRPDLTAVALKGRKSFRWPEPGELVVTNYEILPGKVAGSKANLDPALEGACPDGLVLIADEAHKVKNSKAAMTKKLRALTRLVRKRGGRTWMLTATPLLNRPPDLWALLTAAGVEKSVYGSFPKFAEAMGGYQEMIRARGGRRIYVWQWGGTPRAEVAERLAPVMLRRLKAEVLADLPAKRVEELSVNGLDRQTRALADAAWAIVEDSWDLEALAKSGDRLPSFDEMSAARAALAAAKIPALEALADEAEEAEEPLVVFSAHRAPVKALAEREGWALITGETPPEKRSEIEDRFQRGELRGVAATIKAGGVAITLTAARRAIFCDLDWTPSLNQQAEDRIYRIGQSRGVLITRLVAEHPLDEHVLSLLDAKQRILDASVDAARRQATDDAAAEELAEAQRVLAELNAQSAPTTNGQSYEARLAELEAAWEARQAELAELAHQRKMADTAARRGLDDADLVGGNGGKAPPRRGPSSPLEQWAADALTLLVALDPDRAKKANAAGFSKADGFLGHMLARRVVAAGLSELEWRLAIGVCRKYHRQVGQAPEGD